MELTLQELKLLDVQQCTTVDDIVRQMEHCSFGARMLGEVAATLSGWIQRQEKPLLIYDGKHGTPLSDLLERMVEKRWFRELRLPEEYLRMGTRGDNIVVVGGFSERHEEALYNYPARSVFINAERKSRPGQIRDGYFPDVIFGDPCYLVPVLYASLLERVERQPTSIKELMEQLLTYGGIAAQVARGARILQHMTSDPECTVFMTVSGAMTIAKMGLVICDLIDQGKINYLATTGALMAHGLVESIGLKHYKYNPAHDDVLLAKHKLNRVTDTLEPETNFDQVEDVIDAVLSSLSDGSTVSTRQLHQIIGKYLADHFPQERGILKSAYQHNIPVLVPAFWDSEIGNDIYTFTLKRMKESQKEIEIAQKDDIPYLIGMMTAAKRPAIFTIGGGVPRNFTQNVCPLIELMNQRLGTGLPENTFKYGVRICPDEMDYGHMSGCTYSEGKSWRKMHLEMEFSEVKADATQVLPFLAKYVLER